MSILFFLTPKKEIEFIEDNFSLRQTMEKIEYHRYSVIPILSKEGEYLGTVSEGDILRFIKKQNKFDLSECQNVPIMDIERYRPYECVSINEDIDKVIKLSLAQNFIPIIDDRDKFIGIIKRKDIIDYFYSLKLNSE